MNTLPQKVSAVTPLKGALDGKVKRRSPSMRTDHRGGLTKHVVVNTAVLRAAKKAKRDGEVMVLIDENTVRLVPRGS